ncbi:MAG: alpha/beta hydrolase fold domain-containing protein [Pseudomonadales bacterium]|nr:alpha/beta hydrolase [Pseudomonadales bacterium]NIX07252.1 alpha/beta hydrolase fold domain-containing protein [Pseudomonadales bacterium]
MELDYSMIDPEVRPVLEFLPSELDLITRETLQATRAVLAAAPAPEVETDVEINEQVIAGPGGDLRLLIYRSPVAEGGPGVLWLHGGGYILGAVEDDRARVIAETLGCTVVSVDYRLAPEHPFPAAVEDAYAGLSWLAGNAAALGVDPERIAVAGFSAGAGLAAGLALLNRDRGGPTVVFQLLLSPMLDNLHDTASGQIVNHPAWSRQTSLNAWEMYLGGTPGLDASPYAAASRATDLSGLPKAYVSVGAEDLFRDECIDYARRLHQQGIATELAVFPGMYHAAENFAPQARVSQRLQESYVRALADGLGVSRGAGAIS